MIVVTGGAGFIGSCFIRRLNDEGIDNILVVDELGTSEKWKNLVGKRYADYFEKDDFIDILAEDAFDGTLDGIFHLGACSATTERDASYLIKNNFEYSKIVAEYAFRKGIYFAYASSAATYGDGEVGYSDDHDGLESLKPMNMYGYSKHMFDLWLKNHGMLDQVVGYKYFNVFGPNEYHKGDMMSLICKAYQQVKDEGKIRLFKSYKEKYGDGEQKRDFVYVKDVVDLMFLGFQNQEMKGIFNIGTGKARSWNDLAAAVFDAMKVPVNIEYIEMPEAIRDRYQYFTQAEMSKIESQSFDFRFQELEETVKDYVCGYLAKENEIY